MGNHCIDCDFCGVDLRSYGHKSDCPGPAYEKQVDLYHRSRLEFVQTATIPEQEALKSAKIVAETQYKEQFPPPIRPISLYDR